MARMSRDLRAVGNFAFFGATCFLISAMIYIDGYAIQYTFQSQAPGGMEGYLNLSTSNLQARWEGRRQSQAAFLLAELFGAVAWFTLMGPIGALCDLLGGESRSGTKIVTSCFNAVAMLTLVDLTFQVRMHVQLARPGLLRTAGPQTHSNGASSSCPSFFLSLLSRFSPFLAPIAGGHHLARRLALDLAAHPRRRRDASERRRIRRASGARARVSRGRVPHRLALCYR